MNDYTKKKYFWKQITIKLPNIALELSGNKNKKGPFDKYSFSIIKNDA